MLVIARMEIKGMARYFTSVWLQLGFVLVCLVTRFFGAMGQSSGASVPVSATLADLVNDPQGRGHLLVSLSLGLPP